MVRICFVCLGNICRSPTAEGVFKARLAARHPDAKVDIDSAGTAGYHVGALADERSRAAARRGYELTSRAAQFKPEDFDRFSLILAMDRRKPVQFTERFVLLPSQESYVYFVTLIQKPKPMRSFPIPTTAVQADLKTSSISASEAPTD